MAGPNQVDWYTRQFGFTRQQRARNMYYWDPVNHYVQNMTELRSGQVTATVRSQRIANKSYAVRLDNPNSCQCPDFKANAPLNPQFRCKHIMLLQMVYGTERGRSLRPPAPIGGRVPPAKPIRVLMIGARKKQSGKGAPKSSAARPKQPQAQDWKEIKTKILGDSKLQRALTGQDRCSERDSSIDEDKKLGLIPLETYQRLIQQWMEVVFFEQKKPDLSKPHSLLLNWDTGSGKTIASWLCLRHAIIDSGKERNRKKLVYVSTPDLAKTNATGPVKDAWALYNERPTAQPTIEKIAATDIPFGVDTDFNISERWKKNLFRYPANTVSEANGGSDGSILTFEKFYNACRCANDTGRGWYGIEAKYSAFMDFGDRLSEVLEWMGIKVSEEEDKLKSLSSRFFRTDKPISFDEIKIIGSKYFAPQEEDYPSLDPKEWKEWSSKLEFIRQYIQAQSLVSDKGFYDLKGQPLQKQALDQISPFFNGSKIYQGTLDTLSPTYEGAVDFIVKHMRQKKYEPLAFDPLRDAVVVIDEAHLLFSSTNSALNSLENVTELENFINHSYAVSKDRAVRLVLATATPVNGTVRDAFRLLNLLIRNEKKRFDVATANDTVTKDMKNTKSKRFLEYFEHISNFVSRVDVSQNFDFTL
jgi:hypothetical protein